jgi:ribosomal protein L19
VEKIEIVRRSKTRRAQITFLRKIRGKAARLKEDRAGLEELRRGQQ